VIKDNDIIQEQDAEEEWVDISPLQPEIVKE